MRLRPGTAGNPHQGLAAPDPDMVAREQRADPSRQADSHSPRKSAADVRDIGWGRCYRRTSPSRHSVRWFFIFKIFKRPFPAADALWPALWNSLQMTAELGGSAPHLTTRVAEVISLSPKTAHRSELDAIIFAGAGWRHLLPNEDHRPNAEE